MVRSLVSLVRDLQRRGTRRRRSTCVLESIRLCEEAIEAGVEFVGAVFSQALRRTERGAALRDALLARTVRLEEVDDRTIRELADTDSPQGILAVVEPREWTLRDIDTAGPVRVVALDGVQDPGNVGTICRTAFGLGARGVVLLPGTARLTNPKVLRAGMGATFHFPVAHSETGPFRDWVRDTKLALWVADSRGNDIRRFAPPERLVLAIGNEGAGVSKTLSEAAEEQVSIPLVREADSLNAATAAALLLYEVTR